VEDLLVVKVVQDRLDPVDLPVEQDQLDPLELPVEQDRLDQQEHKATRLQVIHSLLTSLQELAQDQSAKDFMAYIFKPTPQRHLQETAWWENGFSEQDLTWLNAYCDSIAVDRARIEGEETVTDMTSIRKSKVGWIKQNDETFWLFERVERIAGELNALYFGFDLWGLAEGFQYTLYEGEGSHYTWHTDGSGRTPNPPRKLSLSIQLNDPAEYEGGDLEIWNGGGIVQAKREKGFLMAFPSYSLHRVTPITKGVRRSLVCWICGPQFK
jgi:PKHD-type hydroxylase